MGKAAGSRHRPDDIGNARDSVGRAVRETMLPPGAGILAGSGTLYQSSVVRHGDIKTTTILIDLTGLSSTTTDLDIIGTAGVSHIGQITAAVNGTILGGEMTCLEVPAGGADDIDLYSATVGTGAYDDGIAALTETAMVTAGGAWSLGETIGIVADSSPAGNYLYLTSGEAGTAAPYTAGRFLITLYGRVV